MEYGVNAAIVDCSDVLSDELNTIICELYPCTLHVDVYNSYDDFVDVAIGRIQYDLLFINIMLGKDSGISLATEYHKYFENSKLIFYCKEMDRAPDIFDTKPFGLLEIPFEKERVKRNLEKAFSLLRNDKKNYIGLKNKQGIYCLNLHDISIFESKAREVIAYHVDQEIHVYRKLDEIQNEVEAAKMFIRCHQSFLVNKNYVSGISKGKIIMKDGRIISVSKRRMGEALAALETAINGELPFAYR